MFDACVQCKIGSEDLKRLNIRAGSGVVMDDLKFGSDKIVFFSPKNADLLRESVDKGLPYGIINAELIHRSDSPHYARAGIDDTIARIMAKKKIATVFNLKLLIMNNGASRGRIIRRMKENMKRAVKYGAPVLFASCADNKYELFSGVQIKTWAYYLGIENFKRVKTSFDKIFKNN